MYMVKTPSIALFFFILFLLTSFCRGDLAPNQSMTLLITENQIFSIDSTYSKMNKYVFYPQTSVVNQDLALTFGPYIQNSTMGEIIVGISSNENFTDSDQNEICKLNSLDTCLFKMPDNIREVYIFVHCLTERCQMKGRITHVQEIHLRTNKLEYFRFARSEIENFNFSIPLKNDFSRIVLSVTFKYRPISNPANQREFNIEDILPNSGKPLVYKFYDRQVLVWNNTDENLCFQCNITATVVAAKSTVIELDLFLYQDQTLDLEASRFYIDFLAANKRNRYVYTLPEYFLTYDQFSLLISINSLSGKHKTLYLNVDSAPENPESSHWKTSTLNFWHEEEDVVVSKQDLEFFRFIGRMYFISVVGDSDGLYSLYITVNRMKILPLHFGIRQSGLIRKDEIVHYELQYWKTDEEDNQLILSATVTYGHVQIYGRLCGQLMNCSLITLEDIANHNKIDFQGMDESIATLTFNPKCEALYCNYLFAVVGRSPSSSKTSKYDLILKKKAGFVTLIENVCHESFINYLDKEEFRLYVGESNNELQSVSFFINADLQFLVSKDQACEYQEGCSNYKAGNLNNPVIFHTEDNVTLSGAFFVTVFGTISSEFIIFPEVQTKSEKETYINLLEGKFVKYFLNEVNPMVYFQFMIESEENVNVEITLQSNSYNHFRIFLTNDNSKPSKDNYFMSTSSNTLSFHHSSSYEVMYKFLVDSKFSQSITSLDFSIMYSTGKSLKHLEPNEPFYDSIAPAKVKKFLFYVDTANEIVYFSKHAINPEEAGKALFMSFSMYQNQEESQSQLPVLTTIESTLKFNRENLETICKMKNNQFKKLCPLYITIRNDYYQEIKYVLMARTKEYAFHLKFGKEQTITFNEEEEFINLYLIPTSVVRPIDLYIYSLKFTFDTYVSIYKNADKTSFQAWTFPNKTNHKYSMTKQVRNSIVLKATEFNGCWPSCLVLLTVYKEKRVSVGSEEDLLHVLATSGFSEINNNKIQFFRSEKYFDKFFEYSIQQMVKTNLSLLLDLTNVLGTTEIYLKISDGSDSIGLPDGSNYDFFTLDGHITVSTSDVLGKVNGDEKKAIYLLIGVLCVNPVCESNLLVRTSNYVIRKALHGHPYDFSTQIHSSENFVYYHFPDKGFQVKVNKESGGGLIFIVPCFHKKIEECMPKYNQVKFMHSFSSNSIRMSRNDNETFCFECLYLISIEAGESNIKGSFNIIVEGEFLQLAEGHAFYDQVEEGGENLYKCSATSNEELEVAVHVYQNEPKVYVSRKPLSNKDNYEIIGTKGKDPVISLIIDPVDKRGDNPMEEVYILVYGLSQSNYTISCKSLSSFSVLHTGLMEYAEVGPLSKKKFRLNSNDKSLLRKSDRLSLNSLNGETSLRLTAYFKPTKTSADSVEKSQLSKIDLKADSSIVSLSSETHILDLKEGIYEFEVENTAKKPVKFILLLQSDQLTMLPYDIQVTIPFSSNTMNDYETFIPHKGLFVLDFLECLGTIEAYTTTNYEKITKNEDLDQEFLIMPGQPNVKILKVSQGPLYLSFKMPSSDGNLKGFGQLTTHLYEDYREIPQNRLGLPNDGQVEWVTGNGNQTLNISISFYAAICTTYCEDKFLKNLTVTYKMIVSKSSGFAEDSKGKCGVLDSNFISITELKNQGISNETKQLLFHTLIKDADHSYFFNIIAVIEGYPDHSQPISLYYKEKEYFKSNIVVRKVLTYTFIIIMIVVIVLLACCACYFYGGYQRILKRLKSGMRSVSQFEDEQSKTESSLNTTIELRNRHLIEDKS